MQVRCGLELHHLKVHHLNKAIPNSTITFLLIWVFSNFPDPLSKTVSLFYVSYTLNSKIYLRVSVYLYMWIKLVNDEGIVGHVIICKTRPYIF